MSRATPGTAGASVQALGALALGAVSLAVALGFAADLAPGGAPALPPVWDAAGAWPHLLGTDAGGRDRLGASLSAVSVTLWAGVAATALALALGAAITVAGARVGRAGEQAATAIGGGQSALSALAVAMVLAAVFRATGMTGGPGIFAALPAVGAVGLALWPRVAVPGLAGIAEARSGGFVRAARASGASPARLLSRHLLPNAVATQPGLSFRCLAAALATETALSALGLGLPAELGSVGQLAALGPGGFAAGGAAALPGLLAVAALCLGLGQTAERLERRPTNSEPVQ